MILKDTNKQVSRRTFIKGTAAAGAFTALQQTSNRNARQWDREFDVVVLGTGFAGLSTAITAKDPRCQVVDPDNRPISRLYSAGEQGSFWGWMCNGGGNNAEALCTGQIAGRNAAAADPWTGA